MRKVLKLAKREYLAAVKTKGFIIGLIVLPIMMGGSGITMALLKDKGSVEDKRIAVVDRSGIVARALLEAAAARNEQEVLDPESGRKVKPAYQIEIVPPNDTDREAQLLELSDHVRTGELHAFLVVGPDVLNPGEDAQRFQIHYHAQNAAIDEVRRWLSWPINNFLRRSRAAAAGVEQPALDLLFRWIDVEGLGLISVDAGTGEIAEAERSDEIRSILVPAILVMLMFMMTLMGGIPLLSSVMEEKTQRIAEVLLGSLRPFQFMMGKVLGGIGVSLTGVLVYVVGGIITVKRLDLEHYLPYEVLPWFFAFLLLSILMLGALFAALGSACNDPKEAQSLTFPAMLPIMVPIFMMMPAIQHPDASFATIMSLIPPFTPMLMVLRMASPIAIPAWQPWVGLMLVLATALLTVWAGGRVFRVAILMQGTPPRLGNLLRWAVRG